MLMDDWMPLGVGEKLLLLLLLVEAALCTFVCRIDWWLETGN